MTSLASLPDFHRIACRPSPRGTRRWSWSVLPPWRSWGHLRQRCRARRLLSKWWKWRCRVEHKEEGRPSYVTDDALCTLLVTGTTQLSHRTCPIYLALVVSIYLVFGTHVPLERMLCFRAHQLYLSLHSNYVWWNGYMSCGFMVCYEHVLFVYFCRCCFGAKLDMHVLIEFTVTFHEGEEMKYR